MKKILCLALFVALLWAMGLIQVPNADFGSRAQSTISGHRTSDSDHRSTVNSQQSSVIGHRSSASGHRSTVNSHRSSVVGHRPSVIGDRPAVRGRHPVAKGQSPWTEANQITQTRLDAAYGKLPLRFEANQGQVDARVKFLSRGNGYTLFLASNEVVLALAETGGRRDTGTLRNLGTDAGAMLRRPVRASPPKRSAVRMKFVGANPSADVVGLEPLPVRSNYFIGDDSKRWRTDVPNYALVEYKNVYHGINLVYYGNERLLEHDFIVAPGADPKAIRLDFEGANRLSLDADGNLILQTRAGEVTLHAPLIFQEVDGVRRAVSGGYRLENKHRVSLNVGAYDSTRKLTIDPKLTYSTYLGSAQADIGTAIAVDGSGNFYVTGQTASANLFSQNSFKPFSGGDSDAFVVKFNSNLSLVYSTYLGGSGADSGGGIAVDGSGNVYVTGQTDSANSPTFNPIHATLRGGKDGFVTKLDASGRTLIYSTYLGGSQDDLVAGIAVDSAGNAYLTGQTASSNLFAQSSIKPFGGGDGDAFVAKLDTTGRTLVYSTYLGGSGQEIGVRVAVDKDGNAYVTGITNSRNFPVQSAFQGTYGGGDFDGFVTKLNPSGSTLVYSTYLGGSGLDGPVGLALDKDGSAYVAGVTSSTNFPREKALRPNFGGGSTFGDGFVTKLSPSGSALIYSTYLGGSGDDAATSIAVDGDGNAYVTGFTSSTNFPLQDPIKSTFGGGPQFGDAFVTKLNRDGSALVFSTYLGGSGDDVGLGIAVDISGSAYVTGFTTSADFPKEKPLQSTYGGGDSDAFIAKIGETPPSSLNFPVLRTTADTFTGLAFLNLGKDPVTLLPKAYGENGAELTGPGSNPASRQLPASQQLALLAPQLFNFTAPNNEGWMQVQTDKNTVVGFELIGQVIGGDINALDGVDVVLSPSPLLVLTDVEYDSVYTTEIHVVNVTNVQNNLAVELYATSGSQVGRVATSLGPKAKFFKKIQDIFPSIRQPFLGYMVVRGDQDLAAVELLVSSAAFAALNGQRLQTGSSTPTKLYSAQLGNRKNFLFTRLNLVNPTTRTANLVARAIADDGSNLGLPVSTTLGPGQQDRRDVGQMFGLDPNKTTAGSLVIESNVTGILGDVSFGDDSGANAFRASLPLDAQPSKFAAFAHVATAGVFLTGVAAFNPNMQAANTTIKVFRADGSLVGANNLKIDPNGRFSKLLFPELVIASGNQAGGFFTLESDQPISSFALFGAVSGGTFTALSAIPPQRLETATADNPVPAISALSPSAAPAGGAAFTLAVTGSNFINGSVVKWNGSDRATTFVSGTQLTAAITAADIATVGTAGITVFNPPPGGGASNTLTFTINSGTSTFPTNLLRNPGAEEGAGSTGDIVVPIPGWTTTSNFTSVKYGSSGFPTAAESQRIGGGNNFFSGGPNNAQSTATQIVDVSGEATSIDSGGRSALLRAYLTGFGDGDNATLKADFLSAGGTVLGSSLTLGPVSGPGNSFQLKEASGAVPAGTRSIRVTMTSTRVAGSFNDGYFDNLFLGLNQVGAGTVNPIPAITSLSPSSATAGGPALTLTINGSSFVNGSIVQWKGSPRTTTFINNSQLTATINAADIAAAGVASVTVFNPAPGGGTSNAQTFTIVSGGASGTPPTINNVTATVLTNDSVKLDIQLSDPDGDIVKLEFTWSRTGFAQQLTRVLNSPADINLTGLTSGTVTYTFTGVGFLTPFGSQPPDRVDVQATDSKGNKSNVFSKSF